MERKLDKIIEAINKAVLSNVVIYDMSELTPYYDYSIIASCKNHNQGQAACYRTSGNRRESYIG